MEYITIASKDIRPGDQIYNSSAKKQKLPHVFHWVRVIATRLREDPDGDRIIITTTSWETWKHPEEGVFVKRIDTEGDNS